jgi:hypothetical protein
VFRQKVYDKNPDLSRASMSKPPFSSPNYFNTFGGLLIPTIQHAAICKKLPYVVGVYELAA